MKIQVAFDITEQIIADLMCTAIESGYASWLGSIKPMVLVGNDNPEEPWYANPNVYNGNLSVYAEFDGAEDDEGSFASFKTFGMTQIEDALHKMSNEHVAMLHDISIENHDAISADAFLQLLLLGEVVYG